MQHCYIPKISEEKMMRSAKDIKPIVCFNGDLMFLGEFSPFEMLNTTYLQSQNFIGKVDLSKLSVLADVKMLHEFNHPSSFRPSLSEIFCQIPEELRPLTVAFEMIYSPYGQPDFEIFKDEFDMHYHVSIVRLYQKCDHEYNTAKKLLEYPTKASCLPINMEAEKFKKLIEK